MITIHLDNCPRWVLNLFFKVYFFLEKRETSKIERHGYCDEFTEADVVTTSRTRHTFAESCEMYSEKEIHILGLIFSYCNE